MNDEVKNDLKNYKNILRRLTYAALKNLDNEWANNVSNIPPVLFSELEWKNFDLVNATKVSKGGSGKAREVLKDRFRYTDEFCSALIHIISVFSDIIMGKEIKSYNVNDVIKMLGDKAKEEYYGSAAALALIQPYLSDPEAIPQEVISVGTLENELGDFTTRITNIVSDLSDRAPLTKIVITFLRVIATQIAGQIYAHAVGNTAIKIFSVTHRHLFVTLLACGIGVDPIGQIYRHGVHAVVEQKRLANASKKRNPPKKKAAEKTEEKVEEKPSTAEEVAKSLEGDD